MLINIVFRAFERHSARGLTAGTQVDLTDLKIRSD